MISLESGQEIPPQPEPYGACFYVVGGKGTFTVGKEKIELSNVKMVFAAAEKMRGIKTLERPVLLGIHDPQI